MGVKRKQHGAKFKAKVAMAALAELGLRCKQKRKFIATTDSAHTLPIAPNLLNR